MEKRGSFSTRLGFILVSAGCAIGLGNVWRFPYITGQYGGASFVLIYLVFLAILGLPIMVAEFAVGRGSVRSAAMSFDVLEPKGTKWHLYKYGAIAGNFLLMMFYTTVSGWMFYYLYKMATGAFDGMDAAAVGGVFGGLLADPVTMAGCMILVVVLCGGVCYLGVEAGVERITKWMMVALMLLMIVLAINSIMLPNSEIGLKYYLYPDFSKVVEYGVQEVVFAAMGQAFFTLSLGIGALAIFGSYIGKSKRLTGEAIWVIVLDTFVAIMAGLIIFPACFSYGVNPGSGRTSCSSRCRTSLTTCRSVISGARCSSCSWRLPRCRRSSPSSRTSLPASLSCCTKTAEPSFAGAFLSSSCFPCRACSASTSGAASCRLARARTS